MPNAHNVYDLDAFLRRYEIDQGRYSIGPYFSDGVTILKQQVRA